jgi:imidazolonepropionase-like amidohydrolase
MNWKNPLTGADLSFRVSSSIRFSGLAGPASVGLLTGLVGLASAALITAAIAAPVPAAVLAEPSSQVFASTYRMPDSGPVLVQHATILTGSGSRIENGDVLLEHGKVVAVGQNLVAPANATRIDATGRWVTPGLIDPHSHLGAYASPHVHATQDGNEVTSPATPQVWVEHSIWPQDPGFQRAREGGVTSIVVLPGSANLIGGRGVLVKNVAAVSYQDMKFPGAPHYLKMACGENPKTVYGDQHKAPSTLMGNVAGYREAFAKASNFREKQAFLRKKPDMGAPERDIGMETLIDVLEGKILVQMHCYRADQMITMLDVAREFHFKINAFHHAVEAYKIAPQLKAAGTCAVMWSDWWGFKLEAYDGIRENAAMVDAVGACATLHSDDPVVIQHLNLEAAKAMAAGQRAGLPIQREQAIRWITQNVAQAIGMADKIGSLEPGKNADLVIWSGDPFSSFSHADQVYIDGVLRFDVRAPRQPDSDFLLGQFPDKGSMP